MMVWRISNVMDAGQSYQSRNTEPSRLQIIPNESGRTEAHLRRIGVACVLKLSKKSRSMIRFSPARLSRLARLWQNTWTRVNLSRRLFMFQVQLKLWLWMTTLVAGFWTGHGASESSWLQIGIDTWCCREIDWLPQHRTPAIVCVW